MFFLLHASDIIVRLKSCEHAIMHYLFLSNIFWSFTRLIYLKPNVSKTRGKKSFI